jgi:predicted ATPase
VLRWKRCERIGTRADVENPSLWSDGSGSRVVCSAGSIRPEPVTGQLLHGVSASGLHIRTPDQRVRVFVSSTLRELAAERVAAQSAITRLHLTPTMFELGARPHPPRDLYRAYLAQSEVFVGIYCQQYGWVAPGEEVSGLEDEYLLSAGMPKLIYVKAAAEREPRLVELLDRVKADDQASYKPFDDTEELGELLADDLAVLLTERFAQSSASAPVGLRPVTPPTPQTAIVGRQGEIAAVVALLRDPDVHLVTLIGSGGIGKTRLALEVARLLGALADLDAVSFVDLAPVNDAAVWPDVVAATLGIRPEGSRPVVHLLIDRLRGQRVLLILDNFEQLVSAAGQLGELLAGCTDLTVLVTSRIVLHLRGEREVALVPLSTPAGNGEVDLEAIGRSPAVQLLVARAQEVRSSFALTATNAAAVAELCRRLDGIPLALELAGAQLRLLPPAALLRRLGDSLDLATITVDAPDRQRTLRATIEWSHSLLGEAERTLLARLSVFSGAWTIDAAEAVGTIDGDLDALDTLSSLVAQSMVRTDEPDLGGLRFRMLDTIRAYAGERLAERGEADATIGRLAAYLIALVWEVRDALQGPEHRSVAERLDRERDEIRSAIDGALATDHAETVARLLTPLFTYWWSRGLLAMTHELAEKAAALPSASGLAPYDAALLTGARGMSMVMIGRAAEAEPLLRQTVETATALGNARLRAYAPLGLGLNLVNNTPGSDACQRLDEAAQAFRATGDQWGLGVTVAARGQYALLMGDQAGAERMHTEALAAAEVIDNDYLRAQVLDLLGLDAVSAGDLNGAREHYAAAAGLHIRLLDYEGSAYGLSGLAAVAFALDRLTVAARLIGASSHAREVVGVAARPGMQAPTDTLITAVTARLGPSSFAVASEQGAGMRMPDALRYGLAATVADAASDPFLEWASHHEPRHERSSPG